MKIPIYQVDVFTSEVFSGNPAAVCVLDAWIDDKRLQSIAAENNLSETAFLIQTGTSFDFLMVYPCHLIGALLPLKSREKADDDHAVVQEGCDFHVMEIFFTSFLNHSSRFRALM
jgi:hypothetical protein